MQTSRRRRTNTTLKQDNYDPKVKTNDNKQTLYLILGAIGVIVGILIIYKLFSSSTATQIEEIDANQQRQEEYEYDSVINEQEANIPDANNDGNNRPKFGIDDLMKRKRPDLFAGAKNKKLFGNPLEDGVFNGKLQKDKRRREEQMKREKFERERFQRQRRSADGERVPPFDFGDADGPMGDAEAAFKARAADMRDRFGKFGDMDKFKKKMMREDMFRPDMMRGNPMNADRMGPPGDMMDDARFRRDAVDMMRPDRMGRPGDMMGDERFMRGDPMMRVRGEDSPYNDLGEGPIFNGLNDADGGNPRLRPDQVHAARDKLKANMRNRFPGMKGIPGMDGFPGMDRKNKRRGEEM